MISIELFAGAGGLAMGVSRAGFQPAAIVEWDRWCCDTIRENRARATSPLAHWPAPIEGDIRPLTFADYHGAIDLVAGGPPCQPFSLGSPESAIRALAEAFSPFARIAAAPGPTGNLKLGLRIDLYGNFFGKPAGACQSRRRAWKWPGSMWSSTSDRLAMPRRGRAWGRAGPIRWPNGWSN